ncbi:MAG TPA: DoxX family protein [Gemmatimonadaceae bacterium]|nr:DoxX family protein [Gemmatimonadaceae bacterium]
MSATMLESAALDPSAARTAGLARWAGRVLTGAAVLFLLFDAAIKLAGVPEAVQGTVQLGYAPHHLPIIGLIEVVCLVVYLVPRTAPLGAVLWTGYFGGAIATHLRVDNPLLTHTLFPIYVAALVWGGLYLRDARVRALLRSAR